MHWTNLTILHKTQKKFIDILTEWVYIENSRYASVFEKMGICENSIFGKGNFYV